MEYISTSQKGVYVEFDPNLKVARVVDKEEAKKLLDFNKDQLKMLPEVPTDEELLIWAKENYGSVGGLQRSRLLIQDEITKLEKIASLK